jgi:hypothetical protein
MSAVQAGQGEGGKRALEEEAGGRAGEGGSGLAKRQKPDLAGLSTRQYLDQTVVPILLQVGAQCPAAHRLVWAIPGNSPGRASLARERPRDPLEDLAGDLVRWGASGLMPQASCHASCLMPHALAPPDATTARHKREFDPDGQ